MYPIQDTQFEKNRAFYVPKLDIPYPDHFITAATWSTLNSKELW